MRSSVTFTPSFFRPLTISDRPGPSEPAAQTQAPLIYTPEAHGEIGAFIRSPLFNTFKEEYKQVIDSITAFMDRHAHDLDSPLLAKTRSEVKSNFDALKKHLFNQVDNYFGSHKPMMYGVGKEMFHAFDKLLQESHVPLQQRMDAVRNLSLQAKVCSGGVLSGLAAETAILTASAYGLKGVSHQWKIKTMESLILQYVEANHTYRFGDEVHYVNAYYNHLAKEMGVKERPDPFTKNGEISKENLKNCRAHVFAKIKPTQMVDYLANEYRNRIEASLNKENIVEDNIGLDSFNKLQTTMQALTREYGDVPMRALLEQPDLSNDERYAYMGRKQPIRTTRHFLKALKKEKMISYGKNDKLVLGKTDEERMVMLDDMLWVKQGEGKHAPIHEFTASSLLKLAPTPKGLLDTLKKAERWDAKARTARLCSVIQHAHKSLDAEENMKEPLVAWLRDFVSIMAEKRGSSWPAGWRDPVLLLAAALGQPSVLDDLLQEDCNINATDEKGRTALIMAAQGGHDDMVKALIEKRAIVGVRDHQGNTALMHAFRQGKADVLQALVVALFDENERRRRQRVRRDITPSSVAAEAAAAGHTLMVKIFLKVAPVLTYCDIAGKKTALMLAAERGHIEVVELLLTESAMQNEKATGRLVPKANTLESYDENVKTALMLAAEQGHAEVVKILLQAGADMESCHLQGDRKTALMLAVERGHAEVVKALLKAGANMKARDKDGNTALTTAIEKGHAEVVKALLNAGVNTEARDKHGNTALISAVEKRSAEVVKALLDAGVNTEARDKDGKTALILAAEQGHAEMVKALLNARANHAEVAKALLNAGANMADRDEDANIALALAVEKGHAEVVEALLKSKADKNGGKCSALMQAAREGLVAAVKMLIQHGADGCEELITLATGRNEFEAQAATTSSQWWRAALYGGSGESSGGSSEAAMEMAKNLLEAGADGGTALMELAQQNAKTALHVLIKAGADKAKDAQGKTALMRAVEMTASENEHYSATGLQILKTLFEAGADTEVRDHEGRTAEAYAERAAGLGNNKAFHFFLYEAGAQENGSWAFWR